MTRVDTRLAERARSAADLLRQHADGTVTVVHHIDADGVSSGAIALEALHRAGIQSRGLPVRSLDDVHLDMIRAAQAEVLWFCDLGSTAYMHFPAVPKVVCDHHQLVRDGGEEFQGHVNPLLDDQPGQSISGAGTAYLVARALDPRNADLSPLALVGAAADLQDREGGTFTGSNRALLEAATTAGSVQRTWDLAFYGPETRPLPQFLGYAREHTVPGVTGDTRSAQAFLAELGIPATRGGAPTTWNRLDTDEKRTLRSAIVNRMLDCGLDPETLWREVVTLPAEPEGSPTRELQEYGTLLNATARYDRPDVGLAVARGDRAAVFQEALELRDGHKRHLAGALDVLARCRVEEQESLQWVHLEDKVRDTVVGIVCGMALEGLGLRQDLPLIGFAHTPDGRTKVSSRAPRAVQARGIDLATAMRTGAAAVGGQGGGHKGAAGATIPRGSEAAFLEAVATVLSPGASHDRALAEPLPTIRQSRQNA